MRQENNSLAHTTWNSKYHIVFAPKYLIAILNLYMFVITEYSCSNIEIIVIVSSSDIDLVNSHNTVERLLKNAKGLGNPLNRR